ncbi:MAG TPA: PQQ-binding-like beta-propeller repeat protein, partial [Pirellulales bacterium]
LLVSWIVSTVVAAIMNFNGSPWHRATVWLVLFPASLWGPWLLWMFYKPLSVRTRVGVLAALLVFQAVAIALLRIDGMSGDSNLNFAWRWQPDRERFTDLGPVVSDSSKTVASYPAVTSEDFAEFLGPHRNGVVAPMRLDPDWETHPPKELWRRTLGEGWSGFAAVGDDLFTQEQRGEHECVVCYRAVDGEPKWVHADLGNFTTSMGGPGPRGTPSVADGRVFAIGATGRINALEAATGRVLWSRDVLGEFDAGNIDHGVCGSPLIVDEMVIVAPTGRGGPALAAYSVVDGKPLWSSVARQASYSSPMLVKLAGRRQVLIYHKSGVSGVDPADGKVLWETEWTGDLGVNCSQPIAPAGAPDQVFIGTGYGKGSTLLKLLPKPDGTFDATTLWTSREMRLKFATALLIGEHVYGLDDGRFECIALRDGKRAWKKGNYGHGQILLVDGLILIQAEIGELVLVRPDPEKLVELGRIPGLGDRTWNVPAIARGKLYIRNDREAACYQLPLLDAPAGETQATTETKTSEPALDESPR